MVAFKLRETYSNYQKETEKSPERKRGIEMTVPLTLTFRALFLQTFTFHRFTINCVLLILVSVKIMFSHVVISYICHNKVPQTR
jgi:hypothetical protein